MDICWSNVGFYSAIKCRGLGPYVIGLNSRLLWINIVACIAAYCSEILGYRIALKSTTLAALATNLSAAGVIVSLTIVHAPAVIGLGLLYIFVNIGTYCISAIHSSSNPYYLSDTFAVSCLGRLLSIFLSQSRNWKAAEPPHLDQ